MAGYLVGLDINDVAAETFSGNASTTAFTLAAAGTTNSTGVYILGVKQVPTTDYSVSGTTLTFTAAPPSGTNNISVVYTKPAIVNTPADGTITTAKLSGALVTPSTLDVNGQELILDADADTSITADTDDQIDIKIGGADDFSFKANKFEVQTGSNIDMNGTELILDADADTSITADTDDQIDIKIAGADDFRFTANNMNVLSGSTLTIDSGATITNSGTATGFADFTAIGDGSVGAPSLANSGDTNTGIYFPAADTVGVVTGGVEQFRFGSNLMAGGSKNLIINGGMQVNQRYGLTDSGLGGANGYLEPDRWRLEWNSGSASRYTINVQNNGGVNGRSEWLKVDVTTADTSPTGNEYQIIHQYIEARHCLALLDSSGDFKPFTVSFDVILNGDGTGVAASNPKLACFIENPDGNRFYVKDVTVASGQAAAWERVSFTVPADATATVNNDAGPGLSLGFTLVAGSSDNTTDATWGTGSGGDHSTSSSANIAYHVNNYLGITNVQLEVGSVATDFEYEPEAVTWWKCLRYYRRITHNYGQAAMPVASVRSDENQKCGFTLEPPMRTGPSLVTSGNANDYNMNHGNGNTVCDAVPSLAGATTLVASLRYQTDGGVNAGFASQLEFLQGSGNGFLAFDAEF